MENNIGSPNQQGVKAIRILFIALIAGVLMLILVSLIINQTTVPLAPEYNEYGLQLKIFLAIICLVAMLVAKSRFNKEITIAKESLIPVSEKLNMHRVALIKYVAICEAPAIFSVLVFMFTGDFGFLVFSAVLLGFIFVMFPTVTKLATQLGLSSQEKEELESK